MMYYPRAAACIFIRIRVYVGSRYVTVIPLKRCLRVP